MQSYNRFRRALYEMAHPSNPSATSALEFMRETLNGPGNLHRNMKQDTTETNHRRTFCFMVNAAFLLQRDGRTADAEWVLAKTRQHFLQSDIEKEMQILKKSPHSEDMRKPQESSEYSDEMPWLSSPSFA